MSQILSVEVDDQVYKAICEQAAAIGTSPAQIAGTALKQRFNGTPKKSDAPTEAEKQTARERFERHFGTVDLGHPIGHDNEAIDADLAREYGSTHEEK